MYKGFFKKVRYIFLPFLFVSVGYIAFCTLFYWYFVLEKRLITIDDEALFSVSIPLCWLVVFIWLKPRFQLLNIKDKTASGRQLILIVFLILINFLVQSISKKNHDTLGLVNDIAQLDKAEKNANCYEIKDYIIARDIYKAHYKVEQLDDRFSVNLYCVTPMFSRLEYDVNQIKGFRQQDTLVSEEDTIQNLSLKQVKYWCCFNFYESFRDDDKNQQKIDRFIKESKMEIPSKDFNSFPYFRILTKGRDFRAYRKSLNKFEEFVPSDAVLLLGEEEAFEHRAINNEKGVFWVSLVGLISMILFIFIPAFNDEALIRFKTGRRIVEYDSTAITFEKLIVPNKKIWVTQSVIYISLGVLLLMTLNNVPVLSPSLNEVRSFGTSDGELISKGESWRFITALFINLGLPIFFIVIPFFASLGFYAERNLGHFRFLLIISSIGLGTNIITYFINPDSHLYFGFLFVLTGFAAFLGTLFLFKDKLLKNKDLVLALKVSGYILLLNVGLSLFNIDSNYTLAIFISIGIGILLGLIQFMLNRFS